MNEMTCHINARKRLEEKQRRRHNVQATKTPLASRYGCMCGMGEEGCCSLYADWVLWSLAKPTLGIYEELNYDLLKVAQYPGFLRLTNLEIHADRLFAFLIC